MKTEGMELPEAGGGEKLEEAKRNFALARRVLKKSILPNKNGGLERLLWCASRRRKKEKKRGEEGVRRHYEL